MLNICTAQSVEQIINLMNKKVIHNYLALHVRFLEVQYFLKFVLKIIERVILATKFQVNQFVDLKKL